MGLDGRYVAVLDRFEGDQAVLLVEKDDEVVEQFVVDESDLPEDARRQDAALEVTVDSGNLRRMEYLPEETDERVSEAQDRFDRLSQRAPSGEEDRSSDESTGGSSPDDDSTGGDSSANDASEDAADCENSSADEDP